MTQAAIVSAAQSGLVKSIRSLAVAGCDPERGAINRAANVIGHPFGMTGACLMGGSRRAGRRCGARLEVGTMHAGGGMGATGLREIP